MNDSPGFLARPYLCRDCGSEVGFRSRRRSFTERVILPIFLLQPVRCGECYRRDYRLKFTVVGERPSGAPKMAPGKVTPTSNRNIA